MKRFFSLAAAVLCLLAAPALAQKRGGIMVMPHVDNPPSPSIQEEATVSVVVPFMSIFNNLVIFDQHAEQNRPETILPELATSWVWNEAKTSLTFKLRDGVKWHDGKPFTAADVKCTWDMVSGLAPGKIRKSPRKEWFANVREIAVANDREVTFHLNRPQPSLLSMLASGYSPVYPCHIPSADMRSKPIGTGPFKFVEFRMNEIVRLTRNNEYWKPGLPYLDGIEIHVVPNRATRMLGLSAGKYDVSFPTDVTVPLARELISKVPTAQCKLRVIGDTNLMVNRDRPPFDNRDLRMALALAIDHKAFYTIMNEGVEATGASMLPPPEGVWGAPQQVVETFLGYSTDVAKRREQARELMKKSGFGPDKRMKLQVFTRNTETFRNAALILVDHLREIYIDAEVDAVDTSLYYNRMFKREYSVGMNTTGLSLDDPDQVFYENFGCGSLRNYTNYCNREIQTLIDGQSQETDVARRKELVWEIERRIAEDVARPITHRGVQAGCWLGHVKNYNVQVNSIYNGWRFEDVWLDK